METHQYFTSLYQRKLFWDQVLDHTKSDEVLELTKNSLSFKEIDVEEVIKNKDKRQVVVNCDSQLKHLTTKLKFVNELLDGRISQIKTQINNYQMKDFDTNKTVE